MEKKTDNELYSERHFYNTGKGAAEMMSKNPTKWEEKALLGVVAREALAGESLFPSYDTFTPVIDFRIGYNDYLLGDGSKRENMKRQETIRDIASDAVRYVIEASAKKRNQSSTSNICS